MPVDDVDVVPADEVRLECLVDGGVGVFDAAERFVGEDHAEAEGVVGGVAFVDGDLAAGGEAFEEGGGVEAAGATADDRRSQGVVRLRGRVRVRGGWLRPAAEPLIDTAPRPRVGSTALGRAHPSTSLATSGAFFREGGVEFRVVLARHQQGLGRRVQFHRGRQRHVQLGREEGLGLGVGGGRAVGETAGQCAGGLVGAALFGQLADQADPLGLGCADRVAEHQQPGGVAEADHAGQQVGGTHVAAGEADAGEEEGEAGGRVGDAEVGGQGEDRARSGGDPVQGGDHRERALPYRPHHLAGHPVEVQQPGGVHGQGRADDLVHVAAGAEPAALSGQHQRPHRPCGGTARRAGRAGRRRPRR